LKKNVNVRRLGFVGETMNPPIGNRITGTVIGVQGKCNAGHRVGDRFELSCYDSDGLCGFFYHFLFPRLSVMQFGGKYPWWTEGQDIFELECPDRKNPVNLRLVITNRT
jgi:uncharacterized repeat protein (TIGR04076 family)